MADPLAELGLAAAELAHELRNVLAIITQSAHAARRLPEEHDRLLQRILRQSEVGQRLIDEVLALGRGQAAKREPVALGALLTLAREGLDATFVDDCVLARTVDVDPVLFPRALHVLYSNAAAASATTARIVTRVGDEADLLFFEIEDDGPGIPAELRGRLFEPFATAREGGTGLGLTLARHIVEAHGGRLTLHADLPNEPRGTTFRITLPR